MIRKAIIVALTIAAMASLTIGVASSSGRIDWHQSLWTSGEFGAAGFCGTSLYCSSSRRVMVDRLEILDAHAVPSQKRYSGRGWLYDRSVVWIENIDLYGRSTKLLVPFFIPILLALVLSAYPTIALIRGPLRRRCRRRKGLCLKCGYNLTENESGVCPECGSEIDQA